ncbi:MAG TPA: flagellar hook-basal body complex protein [Candidatus Brocadiaceae bacterium]|nr:flagellar hook-basal body complex protein [Candidatus Brocadiaceae bacterium]
MGLGGALNSGVSGIRLHQQMLDVIGNNLANVNTYGYKSSRLLFADLLSQTLSNGKGGNPMQVGKGVTTGSITSNFSQGTLETTNRPFDFALQGEGFFVLNGGSRDYFTRVGAFNVNSSNMLVDSNTGYQVMDTSGKAIEIPFGSTVMGKGTARVGLSGNLDAEAFNLTSEVLLMKSPLTVNDGDQIAADGSDDLNDLDSNTTAYDAGPPADTILITGTKSDGTPVSEEFVYGTDADGTTVQDLIDFLNDDVFGDDATASIDPDTGKLKLKSNTSGQDELTLALQDGGSNTGETAWTDHVFGGAVHTTSTDLFDAQGTRHTITFRFTKESDNLWDMTASMDSGDGDFKKLNDDGITYTDDNTISNISFNNDGTYSTSGDAVLAFRFSGQDETSIVFTLGASENSGGLTQNGGTATAAISSQDGYPYGTFDTVSVGSDGTLRALYTNGITQDITTLKIALFNNLNGLAKAGDNLLIQTTASGDATYTTGGSGRAGTVASGFLEGSNVDMATELTALITAQRGFQLNTKVITTADEILAEAVNLKR